MEKIYESSNVIFEAKQQTNSLKGHLLTSFAKQNRSQPQLKKSLIYIYFSLKNQLQTTKITLIK